MPVHTLKQLQQTIDPPVTIYLKLDSYGKLINPETTELYQNGNVDWKNADANIQSFKVRGKFLGHHHPFTLRPKHFQNHDLNRVVRSTAHHDWKYTIIYKKTDNIRHRLDPKIAVKSHRESSIDFSLIFIIIILGAARYFYKFIIDRTLAAVIRKSIR